MAATAPTPPIVRPGRSAAFLLSEALCVGLLAALLQALGQRATWAPPTDTRSVSGLLGSAATHLAGAVTALTSSSAAVIVITAIAIAATIALLRCTRGRRVLRIIAWYFPLTIAAAAALTGAWPATLALLVGPAVLATIDINAAKSTAP